MLGKFDAIKDKNGNFVLDADGNRIPSENSYDSIAKAMDRTNFGFDGGGIQIDLQQQWIGDFTELGKIEDWR